MITIKDIAKQLGLSPSTVSRALHDHPAINDKTKQMVLDCVKKQNYTPNRNARNLVNQKSYTIGFMIPDISDGFFSRSAFGVEEELYKSGHEIAYSSIERKPERLYDFLMRAWEYQYSGVFITPDVWNDTLVDMIHKINMPVVSLRRKTPRTISDIPYVDSDHYGGACDAVEHLIELGHTAIGMLSADTIIERERLSGYLDTLSRHGLKPYANGKISTSFSSLRIPAGHEAARELFESNPEITAVFTSDDMLAIGVMEYLDSVGKSVPGDVSVIGYDDRPEGRLFPIQLTTVQQSLHELGRQAADMMLRMINSRDYQPTSIVLKTKLIKRRTTGPRKSE